MHAVILCQDRPQSQALRAASRPAHMAYLERQGSALVLAGPFLDEAGQPVGSLFILDVPSLDVAHAFTAADPYTAAGLFASVDVRPWRWTINPPKG